MPIGPAETERKIIGSNVQSENKLILCVDLDGTLLSTDTLWESILLLVKKSPLAALRLPFWALKGKAYLKRQLAKRVSLDVANLPFRQDVLAYLHRQKNSGRELILVTASDYYIALEVASHLRIFSQILASDGTTNLSGHNKRQALEAQFGWKGFDYIGNSKVDLEVWASARQSLLVSPSQGLIRQVERIADIEQIFSEGPRFISEFFRAMRVHQWVKNILLFLPLLTSHKALDFAHLNVAFAAFFAFSFCASGLYIMNDLLDLSADRRHPKKRSRTFASGRLSIPCGLLLSPVLISLAFLLALETLPIGFTGLLGLYAFATSSYSSYLKKLAIVDVLTLAGLYTLRIFAGGLAFGVTISAWLSAFSLFLFLSLALGKRHSELQFRKVNKHEGIERRAYVGADKEALGIMGIVSGYLSVLVLALYLTSQEVLDLYQQPQMLWLGCPLLLYWISRTWLLAQRGSLDDDPLIVALKDPKSYFIAAISGLLGIWAM